MTTHNKTTAQRRNVNRHAPIHTESRPWESKDGSLSIQELNEFLDCRETCDIRDDTDVVWAEGTEAATQMARINRMAEAEGNLN